ncbi:Hypothetical protein SCF082_LOCUS30806 [Durusdinium trenchii]|uniref:Methyltransferase FkbM domain-containing protein n=1 Tax=Durusdinium trenchii TaxID=1381693 RepID=A0ABP0N0S0_9DINO
MSEHEELVETVKQQQRSSEIAREGWRHYCGALAEGVRDPKKHSSEFLKNFLKVLEDLQHSQVPIVEDTEHEPRLVRSACPSLGSNQLELLMPESEVSVMKDVVNANCYGFAPGKASVLSQGDVLLDIGAHVGIASALALRTADVSVISVEPHPVTFELLTRNLAESENHTVPRGVPRVRLLQLAVADVNCAGREFFGHRGTNNPSRLFFASLFDTRSHSNLAIQVPCIALQELILQQKPTVVKIDAEGAERFLKTVDDFVLIRKLVVEWDWTHNRSKALWEEVRAHLEAHGFKLKILGRMPEFDQHGQAILTDARCKKRGNTGMIFQASRKLPASERVATATGEDTTPVKVEADLGEDRPEDEDVWSEVELQPSLELQLGALSIEDMEARLRQFGEELRPVKAEEFFVLGFKERRRSELLRALCEAYRSSVPRELLPPEEGMVLPPEAVRELLEHLRTIRFEENQRPSVHASGYLVLKAGQAAKLADSWGSESRSLGRLWALAEALLRGASPKAAAFHFTSMAVTQNFRGSPHIDQNDFSVQYALSVGDFTGGGELCVEESPSKVRVLQTQNRLVCIDGRFPHWVSGYRGERYSIIYYRSSGQWDPPSQAVHPV